MLSLCVQPNNWPGTIKQMSTQAQWPTSFPFLSLPRELQAEVVRNVGDIVALRDLLAMPQVARSVGPFLRLVTNDDSPHWFIGLEEYVKHMSHEDLPTDTVGIDGPVYILDLLLTNEADLSLYFSLRRPIVALTVVDSQFAGYQRLLPDFVDRLTSEMYPESLGIIGQTGQCHVFVEPSHLPRNNLTLVGCEDVSVSAHMAILRAKEGWTQSVSLRGSLSSLSIEDIAEGTTAEDMRLVYNHYKELIDGTGKLSVYPTKSFGVNQYWETTWEIFIDGWEIALVSKLYEFVQCCQFTNVKINTKYTDETADAVRDGVLLLEILSTESLEEQREKKRMSPIISNVIAPGLRQLTIQIIGPLFPILSMLWFPHLEVLKLTGLFEQETLKVSFEHLEPIEQTQELSKLVHGIKELYVDQFTIPVMGFALPSSFVNLTMLSLKESSVVTYESEVARSLERLRLRHGKIRLPKLKQLEWSSISPNNERALDFSQLSKWFSFPRLETLLFESLNEYVSLMGIVNQVPMIKELNIAKLVPNGYTTHSQKGTYPTPLMPMLHTTFEKLERLVFRVGYHSSGFKGIRFPHLTSLEIDMDLNEVNTSWFQADMPVLEDLTIYAVAQLQGKKELNITGFSSLKVLSVMSDIEILRLFGCLKLEKIFHTGSGLKEFSSAPQSAEKMVNLKTVRYTSQSGRPCHEFLVHPSVDVDVR